MEITNINQLDFNKTYSYADYLLWKFKERVELFKGKILEMSPAPSRRHQKVLRNVNRVFDKYFYGQKCELFFAPFDVRLQRHNTKDEEVFTVVQPDLCVICDEEKLDDRGCVGAPDLIIEILSPGNSKREMKDKFDLYEESGVREYWIVDPNTESVFVNLLENGKYTIKKPILDDVVRSYIFPNLEIHTDDIFNM